MDARVKPAHDEIDVRNGPGSATHYAAKRRAASCPGNGGYRPRRAGLRACGLPRTGRGGGFGCTRSSSARNWRNAVRCPGKAAREADLFSACSAASVSCSWSMIALLLRCIAPRRAAVEALELADEIVKTARRRAELAQRQRQRRAGRRRPQQQRQMREIAALGKNADQVGHVFCARSTSTP